MKKARELGENTWQDFSALAMMSITQRWIILQDSNIKYWNHPTTAQALDPAHNMPQLTPTNISPHHILLKYHANCMVGAGERQEGKSYTAIDFLALKQDHWKAEFSRKKNKKQQERQSFY